MRQMNWKMLNIQPLQKSKIFGILLDLINETSSYIIINNKQYYVWGSTSLFKYKIWATSFPQWQLKASRLFEVCQCLVEVCLCLCLCWRRVDDYVFLEAMGQSVYMIRAPFVRSSMPQIKSQYLIIIEYKSQSLIKGCIKS